MPKKRRARFQAGSWLKGGSVKAALSRPAHQYPGRLRRGIALTVSWHHSRIHIRKEIIWKLMKKRLMKLYWRFSI